MYVNQPITSDGSIWGISIKKSVSKDEEMG